MKVTYLIHTELDRLLLTLTIIQPPNSNYSYEDMLPYLYYKVTYKNVYKTAL